MRPHQTEPSWHLIGTRRLNPGPLLQPAKSIARLGDNLARPGELGHRGLAGLRATGCRRENSQYTISLCFKDTGRTAEV